MAQETVILGGVLQEMVKFAYDWRPHAPGTPAYRAEQTLRRMLDEDRLRPQHLPMIYHKLLHDLPVSTGRGGPHDTLLKILADYGDPSIIPFAEELFEVRVERGLDEDQVLSLLTAMPDNPDAVATLVTLIVAHRPRHGSSCLPPLGMVPSNGSLCFPALASLIDVPEYADAVLDLASKFYKRGTLPESALPYVAAGVESRETELLRQYLAAAEDFRDVSGIVSEQAHLMDLAEILIDVPEVEEIVTFVAEYGNHQLAMPAIIVLLNTGREVSDERLKAIASHPVDGRRELRAQLSGVQHLEMFPLSRSLPRHWAETEIGEWLSREGFPVPPNELTLLGATEWDDGPDWLNGWYLLFAVSAVSERELRRGQGEFDRVFLAGCGPFRDEPSDEKPVQPWLTMPGTYVHLENPIADGDAEKAWTQWRFRHPGVRENNDGE